MDDQHDIAIIGISLEFPGTDTVDDFYASLLRRKVLYINNNSDSSSHELVSAWGGVKNLYGFDYNFFGYSYKEACYIDPQHRLLLMHSWKALESAGYGSSKYRPVTGVFASASINRYLHNNLIGLINDDKEDEVLIGNIHDFLASRVAFKLDLKGPALNIQSGCSSSLVAIHQARLALLTGQCNMALVGAVSLSAPNDHGYEYEKDGIRSQNGEVRPFDSKSTGTVFTNGVAVIVLKELENALSSKDNIIGVISSTAVNNDGCNKASFTSPCSLQQAQVIKRAMEIAKITPEQYALIETHGTGTNLGDPIEFYALKSVFSGVSNSNLCALQSVKANIGHLDTASGIAGVIKTALILKNRKIPPQINFEEPNSKINLASSPFYVNAKESIDLKGKDPIYAGITALGIGGTNAHVIMKTFQNVPKDNIASRTFDKSNGEVILLSAHTDNALKNLKKEYLEFIDKSSDELHDISYSSIFSREKMKFRSAFVSHSIANLRDQLNVSLNKKNKCYKNAIVFLFSGQGSQYFKMGKELFYSSSIFRNILSDFLNTISKLLDRDCFNMLFIDEQNQDQLYETRNAQPILLAIEVALAQYLIICGVKPQALLGHSLGKYSALVVSNALSFENAVKFVTKRAELMSKTDLGGMASVMTNLENVKKIKPDSLDIAAINGYDLITISDKKAEVESFISLCEKQGIICYPLPTNRAFHSHLLDTILERYYQFAKSIIFNKPLIPIVSNLHGKILQYEDLNSNYLVNQMRKPVQFLNCIEFLQGQYNPIFLEVGPGTTLKSLTKGILQTKGNSNHIALNTLPHPKDRTSSLTTIQKCLTTLWENNHEVDWSKVRDYTDKSKTIVLPTYPFELEKCYVKNGENRSAHLKKSTDKVPLSYVRVWKQHSRSLTKKISLEKYHILFLNKDHDVKCLVLSLQEQSKVVLLVYKCEENFDNSKFLLQLAQACVASDIKNKIFKICFVSHHGADLQTTINPSIATLQAQIKVVNQELSPCKCLLIDVLESENWWDEVKEELSYENEYPIVVLRHGERFVEHFEPFEISINHDNILGNNVIILGGTGNVGLQYAETLLKTTKQKIFLVQRSSIKSLENPKTKRDRIKAQKIEKLRKLGKNRLFILSADIGNLTQLSNVITTALKLNNGNSIDNIVHTAGVDASMHYRLLKDIDNNFYQACFYAKKEGLSNLSKIVKDFKIKNCHIISSISSVLGGIGMFVYGGMHSYIDSFILWQQQIKSDTNWSVINWEAWNFQINESEPEEFQMGSFGNHLNQLAISPELGSLLIEKIYGKIFSNLIISNTDLNERYKNWVLDQVSEYDISRFLNKVPRPNIGVEYVSPSTKTQEDLTETWTELLGVEGIGIHDSFFELGGHSLLALQMLKVINKSFGIKFSIIDLFEFSTIKKLSDKIEQNINEGHFRSNAIERFNRKKSTKINFKRIDVARR
ncbi:MAG: acyltransferase domain-containing protein [Wolbachia pipientis]|jgi:acyl transferase domain-containing protein/acyl carrier protein|nr:acyltransferase domain-containing protein [Wolbachia pipientis]